MTTTTHHHFELALERYKALIPGILDERPIATQGATLALIGDQDTLCRWDEAVAETALSDFETRESFDVGTDWHIDIFYTDDHVSILVWRSGAPCAEHVITVDEREYFASLERARDLLQADDPTRS